MFAIFAILSYIVAKSNMVWHSLKHNNIPRRKKYAPKGREKTFEISQN